mmetsp:Transcript_13101/g.15833  ORF Transcript_13101/g.15833 Transcript_13101/m.15833 type:complete len:453 (+) Transcript_13101:3-1361(+)
MIYHFFSCEFRGVGGVLKQRCSDFIVTEIMDEIPKLCPDADRNYHYWLKVKRTNKTTLQVVADLRQILGVDTIGYAGLKDKRAIATQTFSILSFSQTFERELDYKKDFEPLSKKGIEIIDISKSRYKLKQCMHQGNYFEIILADCSCNMEDIHSIAALIRAHGFPNYYGPQRFSKRCGLAVRGARIISEISAARRRAHFGTVKKLKSAARAHPIKRFACEAFASMLFNLWLAHRLQSESDIPRINQTGPVFGANMDLSDNGTSQRILEDKILTLAGIDNLNDFPINGFKRDAMVIPKNLFIEKNPRGLLFKFFLPQGAYATMLLREFSKLADFCYFARGPTENRKLKNNDAQLLSDAEDDDTAAVFLQQEDTTKSEYNNNLNYRIIPRGRPKGKNPGAYFAAKGADAAIGRRRERVVLRFCRDPNSKHLENTHPLVRREAIASQVRSTTTVQ